MLSNPQNLDIGDMITSPEESPFAKALASAKFVLVVPNRKGSIYSRIWCVYEAYLGYTWNKTIRVASRRPRRFWRQMAVIVCILIASASGTVAILSKIY